MCGAGTITDAPRNDPMAQGPFRLVIRQREPRIIEDDPEGIPVIEELPRQFAGLFVLGIPVLIAKFQESPQERGMLDMALERGTTLSVAPEIRAWDWRTRWERDGTISQFPMTQQWIKRVRGDGPVNIVD